jgi:fumarate reductase flavoprotein subunit
MLNRWHPRSIADAGGPIRYVGTDGAQGDAFGLGAQVGAQIVGEGRGSRTPVGPLGGSYLPGYAMVVNRLGRRYYDETAPYGLSEYLIARQPGATSYVILDDATKRAMQREADVLKYLKVLVPGSEVALRAWTSEGMDDLLAAGAIASANSIEDLARRLGIPPDNLAGAVERYNQGVAAGEDADYLKNPAWLRPISTPPFYASRSGLTVFGLTATGLRIDHNAAVMHQTSRSIPGLFAAGECAGGVLGDVYVGSGNSLANTTVFGRVAGRSAAAAARAER